MSGPQLCSKRPTSPSQRRILLETVGSNGPLGDLWVMDGPGQNATLQNATANAHTLPRASSESFLPPLKTGKAARSSIVLVNGPAASLPRQCHSSEGALELDVKVALKLKDMGFSVSNIREAAWKLGSSASIKALLLELQSTPDALRPTSSNSSKSSTAVNVSDELEKMGLPPRVVAATLSRLGPNACSADALNALVLEPDSPLKPEDGWTCAICFEPQLQQGWKCSDEHRFCTACMRQHIKAVAFPRCPQVKCTYELTVPDLRLLKISRKRVEVFELGKLQNAIGSLGSDSRNGTLGEKIIHCKRDGCSNVVLVPHDGSRERFACPCGAPSFCTQCGEIPYHYHGDCGNIRALRQQWLGWVSEARDARKRQLEAQRALEERCHQDLALRQDEVWKSLNCRLCPHCQRTVEKLDGCNSMRCGSNFHGGSLQSGCGKEFDWDKALPYTAQRVVKSVRITFEEANWMKGLIHPGVNCGICNRNIYGPRLRCVHCESFSICAGCEPDLGSHDLDHVFEVILDVDFDWSQILLPLGLMVRITRHGGARPPRWYGKQFEGTICKIVEVVEGVPACAGYEPGTKKSTTTNYKVKVKGHRGTDPELPIEHLLPLFTSRFEAMRLLEGRWNEPEPDLEENVPWIKF